MSLPRLFHGGVPDIPLGGRLLPPSVTSVQAAIEFGQDLPGADVVRRDRVFLATTRDIAAIFAAMHPSDRGEVYEVEPVGEVEPDPDYVGPDGESWQCPEAVVVRRFGRLSAHDVTMIRRVLMGLTA